MDSSFVNEGTKRASALESALVPLFAKTPHLPHHILLILAQIAPWLALLFGVLGVLALLPALMLIPMASYSAPVMGMMGGWYPMMFVSLIVGIITTILNLLAFRPLLHRQKKGWNLLFYSTGLSILTAILAIAFGAMSGFNIIASLLGLWLLFEVRGLYHA